MTFQLDIRHDDEWVKVTTNDDPAELVEYSNLAKQATNSTGYRIYKADRKRLKSGELAGAPKPAPRRPAPGVLDTLRQAHLAAEWIERSGTKTIHVFPLGKTGQHVSNKFRLYLFSKLAGITKTWLSDQDRVVFEAAAVKAGYTIIEVDPEDWVFAPELEVAA